MNKQLITLCFILLFCSNLMKIQAQNEIFDRFPWLTNLVNPTDCTTEEITVYTVGVHSFVLVTDAMGIATLYNQEGQFYCQNADNYDCIAAYQLEQPIDNWSCATAATCDEAALVQALQRRGAQCYEVSNISKIPYNGTNYYRTTLGLSLNDFFNGGLFPCGVQENFGAIYDCEGQEICQVSLTPPSSEQNAELCNSLLQQESTVIWTNPNSNCKIEDPFEVAFIQNTINENRFVVNRDGDTCRIVSEIVQFDFYGFTFFKITENPFVNAACPDFLPTSRIHSCTGRFIGGTGYAPSCANSILCPFLFEAAIQGKVIWSASNENTCNIIITNNECRRIDIYDEQDNLLTTMQPGPNDNNAPFTDSPVWEDPRPLADTETRTYIFKENNLVIGQQTVSCANREIEVVSDYEDGCFTATGDILLTNTGCRTISIFNNTLNEVVGMIEPGERSGLGLNPFIYILLAENDTLDIFVFRGSGDIDSGGCEETPTPDCNNFLGTIFFENCDGGQLYYFIELDDGRIFDPYLAPNSTFTPIEGQKVRFDFEDANFDSPCSFAEKAINITCIEAIDQSVGCTHEEGTIIVEKCDDGRDFYFIRTADGRLLDAYFVEGIEFLKYHGQQVRYNYHAADFASPCSQAVEAVWVTCIEDISTDGGDNNMDPIFTDFSWLSDLVDPNNCSTVNITVYQSGIFQFVYIETSTSSILYFQDGTLYCTDAPNYDCRAAYSLTTIADTWGCGNFQTPQSSKIRTNEQLQSVDFTVFPNPTTDQLTIQWPTSSPTTYQLQLIDILGHVLYEQEDFVNTQTTIDLTPYQDGIYYIVLKGKGKRAIRKLVKQRL